jgi:hypothetical protein
VRRAEAPTHGWRSRELFLLVGPVGAVLLAADEIGELAAGDRAEAWAWFVALSAIGMVVGGWSGARSPLGVSPAARRRSTVLATYTALIGVVVAGFLGGLTRAMIMGVAGGLLLAWVIVRVFRVLRHGQARRG